MSNNRIYDEILRKFTQEEGGLFVVLSADPTFLKNFRGTMFKMLALPPTCAVFHTERERALREIRDAAERKTRLVALIEREMHGFSCIEFVKNLKILCPDMAIIVLTGEIERERLILLHELGVGNIITKPISANTLVEKIAFTIKPPSKIGELIDAGKRCILLGEYDKALEVSAAVLELKPDSPAALMLRGDALKAKGDHEQAALAYERAARTSKLYLEPVKKLAEFYRDLGKPEKELDYLEKLDTLSPLNVERKIAIGGINMQLGNVDKAQAVFDQAVKITTRQAMGMISDISKSIAEVCMEHNPEMAETFLRQSLEAKRDLLDRSDVETFNSLGIALRKQGRWEDALKEYRKATKVAPDDENLYYNMALALQEGKDFPKAAKQLDKAISINPRFGLDHASLCFNIGFIFAKAQRHDIARHYLMRALKLNPDHSAARKLLDTL